MSDYEYHELANSFPRMSESEFNSLVKNMEAHGFDEREPIWVYQGKILDGRHRFEASKKADVKPEFEIFEGTLKEAKQFVIRRNLDRRHLTTEQKAAVGVNLKKIEAEQAEERKAHGKTAPGKTLMENFPEASKKETGTSRDKAGEKLGVSGRTIDKADKIAEQAPDVFEKMQDGEFGSVRKARQAAELDEDTRQKLHEKVERGEFDDYSDGLSQVSGSDDGDEEHVHVSENTGFEQYRTPKKFVESARRVMGSIDLDPATHEKANRVIAADTYYTQEDDGLSKDWLGNVFLNPPYTAGLVDKFAKKLVKSFRLGDVKQAVWLSNNSTDTKWFHQLIQPASLLCFPKGRIQFDSDKSGSSPLQGQVFVYFGHNSSAFVDEFEEFGCVAEVK